MWKTVLSAAQRTIFHNGGVPLSPDQAEAAGLRAASKNPISYWRLHEPSGTRSDSWGTNHLTDNNTVTTAAGSCVDAITQVNDLSGKGNHLTQSTQADKPALVRSGNHNAMRIFRAANTHLLNATTGPFYEWIVVAKTNSADFPNNNNGLITGSNSGIHDQPLVGGAPGLFVSTGDAYYLNNISYVSGNWVAPVMAFGVVDTYKNAGYSMDVVMGLQYLIAGRSFDGDVAVIIGLSSVLPSIVRYRVSRYYGRKYGIAVA